MFKPGFVANDRYLIEELIAPGGMGQVWKSVDNRLNRSVALKTILPQYIKANADALAIFKDEAKAGAALLGHPNIVGVLDVDQDIDIEYIVMEYIDGITVHQWIMDRNFLDPVTYFNTSLFIGLEICKGLDYAHKKGILHRDIKPLNSFISNYGVIKVGDFGLARIINASTRAHTVKETMTYNYAAPEQWENKPHTIKTDIYQLGCTLYELFTGRSVFNLPLPAIAFAHINTEPQPPKEVNPLIPKKISDMILKALKKDQDERAELWEIRDTLSEEIQFPYNIELNNFNELSAITIEKIGDLLDIELSPNTKPPHVWTVPDYTEALSESIQMILTGITDFRVYCPREED
ncbi:serine/threonine protein kinase [Pelosinus sp. sgz500959]|uniref:serine/threonine protein kinase n=1 Tax=Pelosinus sp. sgz500959 TaxID=3242472 RepID=UPI00367268EE